MNTEDFLKYMNMGNVVIGGSEMHKAMSKLTDEAMKLVAELNGKYHSPAEVREIFFKITGKPLYESFVLFPPFYTDCGKNITVGKNVFIGSCCYFQDQGGVKIGNGVLVGHGTTFATLNHCFEPEMRSSMIPKPIVVGDRVWIGANVTILPGVTIGDNAIIAAGAVVAKDVPADSIAAGVPARVIKSIYDEKRGV
ncbi:MAG: sugar O-acetyltransferase [Clostridiales bacterium]|nr:sugar O-acetyltransferase [Clostridiales bacterium]